MIKRAMIIAVGAAVLSACSPQSTGLSSSFVEAATQTGTAPAASMVANSTVSGPLVAPSVSFAPRVIATPTTSQIVAPTTSHIVAPRRIVTTTTQPTTTTAMGTCLNPVFTKTGFTCMPR